MLVLPLSSWDLLGNSLHSLWVLFTYNTASKSYYEDLQAIYCTLHRGLSVMCWSKPSISVLLYFPGERPVIATFLASHPVLISLICIHGRRKWACPVQTLLSSLLESEYWRTHAFWSPFLPRRKLIQAGLVCTKGRQVIIQQCLWLGGYHDLL